MTVPRVLIEGLGDVTAEVIFPECQMRGGAQGEASESQVVLRDLGGATRDFITGKRLTIDLAGTCLWAGYVFHVSRQFWFDVDDPQTMNRRFVLRLVDLNILFTKRIVFKQSSPKRVIGPTYRNPTYDDDIISDLLSGWLDLSADDLDTSTLVDRVAIVNPSSGACDPAAQNFYPFNGSMQWGEAMTIIAQVPAAIWGLLPGAPLGSSPFGRLFYADVDSEDAPFDLADVPGPGRVGYREVTVWDDGSDLMNDAMDWGAGKGDNHMVFDRREASASIDLHGRWQQGSVLFNVWCQDTIDKITDSIVNGSPSSRRGHKNDVRAVELAVTEDGFRIGQKARFIREAEGIDEILPIRTELLTFPTKDSRLYRLRLSEALDQWGFEDPPLPFPNIRGGGSHIHHSGGPRVLVCSDCGITDDFNRLVAADGWGVASSGLSWHRDFFNVTAEGGHITFGVIDDDPGYAHLNVPHNPFSTGQIWPSISMDTDLNGPALPLTIRTRLRYSGCPASSVGYSPYFGLFVSTDQSDFDKGYDLRIDPPKPAMGATPAKTNYTIETSDYSPDGDSPSFMDLPLATTGVWINVVWYISETEIKFKIWEDSEDEPDWHSPSLTPNLADNPLVGLQDFALWGGQVGYNDAAGGWYWDVDYVDISGVNRCSEFRFDNFNRVISAGSWGTSDHGLPWGANFTTSTLSADGAAGVFTGVSGATRHVQLYIVAEAGEAPWNNDVFTMESRFHISRVDASPNDCSVEFMFLRVPGVVWKKIVVDFEPVDGVIDVDLQSDGGSTVGSYHEIGISFAAGWWRLKIEAQPGSYFKFKIWREPDPEPDWRANLDDTGGCGIALVETNFIVNLFSRGVARTIRFDWLDFDYEGKPCYVCPRFDDFSRLASGWGPGWTPWSDFSGEGEAYTDGGNGVLKNYGQVGGFNNYGQIAEVTTTGGPWELAEWTTSVRFSFDWVPDGLPPGPDSGQNRRGTIVKFGVANHDDTMDDWLANVEIFPDPNHVFAPGLQNGAHVNEIRLNVGGHDSVDWPDGWGPGDYFAEWIHNGTLDELRVWPVADARPAPPTVSKINTAGSFSGKQWAAYHRSTTDTSNQNATDDTVVAFDYFDFDYAGKPCVSGPVFPS